MKNYMENWNEIIGYVEGLTDDILDIMCTSYTSEDEKIADVKYTIAIYSLMLIRNYYL